MVQRAPGNPPILAAEALATNPLSGAVVADSGAVPATGLYEVRVIVSSSAAANFALQRRNAGNTANVAPFPVTIYTQAQSAQYALMVPLLVGERFRVTMGANLTGNAQACVQLEGMA